MRKELCYQILSILLEHKDYIPMSLLSKRLSVSTKTIQNYIASSTFTSILGSCRVEKKQSLGIRLIGNEQSLVKLKRLVFYNDHENEELNLQLSDSVSYIIQELFTNEYPITCDSLGKKMYKSKSAVRMDVQKAKQYLKACNVHVIMKENNGIYLDDSEEHILVAYKQFVLKELSKLNQVENEIVLKENKRNLYYLQKFFYKIDINKVKDSICYSEEILNNKYTDNDRLILLIKLAVLVNRMLINKHVVNKKESLKHTKEYFAAQVIKLNLEGIFPIQFREDELYEISEYILASRKQNNDNANGDSIDVKVAEQFLARVGDFLEVDFEQGESLLKNLLLHLRPAMRRLRYGVTSENPILRQIRYEFSDIYLAVLTSIEEIEKERNISFDINEIGYICLHIAAAINRKEKGSYVKTCLICDGGITISNYLESVIKLQVQEIHLVKTISSEKVSEEIYEEYDLILDSTVVLNDNHINVINIEPFFNQSDVLKIHHWILSKQLYQSQKTSRTPVFNDTVFMCTDHVASQQEVLEKYGLYLETHGFVEDGFVESLIAREQKASTLIGRGVAVPHGSREFVRKSTIVIIKLENRIMWGDEFVDMVFLLAMNFDYEEESKKIFRRLYQIIKNDKELIKLKNTRDLEEIKAMFIENTMKEEHRVEIRNIFQKEHMNLNMSAKNKEDAFRQMATMFLDTGVINDVEVYVDAVMQREEEFSTGIGYGIAIPHARCRAVTRASIAVVRLNQTIDYASFDDEPISMLFMIAVPDVGSDDHIKILSMLSRKFMHADFRESLKSAKTTEDIMRLLNTI